MFNRSEGFALTGYVVPGCVENGAGCSGKILPPLPPPPSSSASPSPAPRALCSSGNKSKMAPNEKVLFQEKLGLRSKI